MQGNGPDEEYTDPHGECAAEIARLKAVLVSIVTFPITDTKTNMDAVNMARMAAAGLEVKYVSEDELLAALQQS